MKKITALLVFCSSFCCSGIIYAQQNTRYTHADSLRGTLSSLRSCYDVLSYNLAVDIDPSQKKISGSNEIKFKAITDFSVMQLDLFANLNIEGVDFKSEQLSFKRDGNAFFVQFPDVLKRDSCYTLVVRYSGIPLPAKNAPWDGGFSWSKDSKGNDWIAVSCQGTGASCWWPCKDHQSDEPEQQWITVTVPEGYTDVSNGRLLSEEKMPDGKSRFHWYVSSPINNYDVTLNIARYSHFSDVYTSSEYSDPLTLDYYVLPEHVSAAKKQFQQVKPMMDCYYHYFGEYPFVKDGYKLVETPYLGMEHQSAVAYGNQFMNGYLGMDLSGSGAKFDYIIIHESAHEWWGNSITSNDIADMWIHEGFASYSEALYMECTAGKSAYLKYINGLKAGIRNDKPVIGPRGVNKEGSDDMYPKGALLLHTLRSVINDDSLFFSILKGIQQKYKWKTVDSGEIEQYFSSVSGLDLTPVFDQYLRKTEVPTLQMELRHVGNDLDLSYRWQADKEVYPDFSMPLRIPDADNKDVLILPEFKWQHTTLHNMDEKKLRVLTDLFYIYVKITNKS